MGNKGEFRGVFARELKMLLDVKHSCGIKYTDEERMMYKFDELSLAFDCTDGLTKELVLKFIEPRPNWSQSTYEKHINLILQIVRFLNLHGIQAYIPDTKLKLETDRSFSPYIFSIDEIKRIFEVADHLYSGRSNIRSADFYPVLFRFLYSSGLRISEALFLTMKDVDMVNGTVFIKNGKNHKDRLLPVNPQMIPYLENYADKYHKSFRDDDYFFSPPQGGHYDKGTVYHRFRDILFKCGISHGGRKKGGPRLHDVSYPNLNKIRTFRKESDKQRNPQEKGSDNYYFFIGRTPQNVDKLPSLLRHFLGADLSFSSSSVAKAFASCSVVISK